MQRDAEATPPSIELIVPHWPAPASVRACCTTRRGGVSRPPFDHLNLSSGVGDDPAAVTENRARLTARLRLPAKPLWMRQVHGTRVLEAGVVEPGSEGDACIARTSGTPCAVSVADCLPVLFCAGNGSVVAAAHAGWRGLAAGVLENTIAEMKVAPSEIIAWLGPAIGASAYEVGPEVRDAFVDRHHEDAVAFSPSRPMRWNARPRRVGPAHACGAAEWRRCTAGTRAHTPIPGVSIRTGETSAPARFAALIWIEAPAPRRQQATASA